MWKKLGVIFDEQHAQLPTVQKIGRNFRVFYSTKIDGKSAINCFEINKNLEITNKSSEPIFTAGERGCFDDSGVMPASVMEDFLFYTGWNCNKGEVPYGHGIGVATIEIPLKLNRIYQGPLLDRTIHSPFLCNSPYVIRTKKGFKMWYCRGTGWDGDLPLYAIAEAYSKDFYTWEEEEETALGEGNEAISRPCVIGRHMWYAYKTKTSPYKIGYAHYSRRKWHREDSSSFALECSPKGWDSEMTCYPYCVSIEGELHMFYNGNGYGKTGIGVAKWE